MIDSIIQDKLKKGELILGRGDNRLTPLVKQRRAQRKKKLKLKRLLAESLAQKKSSAKLKK